jgi:hypothetical protein
MLTIFNLIVFLEIYGFTLKLLRYLYQIFLSLFKNLDRLCLDRPFPDSLLDNLLSEKPNKQFID